MKLSTFLLLSKGTAFLPSITTLQKMDPLEGDLYARPEWLLAKLQDITGEKFDELEKWILNEATESERSTLEIPGEDKTHLYARIFVRGIAKRRAVWCWFSSNNESAGMWAIYGRDGIAVRTTIASLLATLPDNNFQIAKIRYADRQSSSPNQFNPESGADDERLQRPHLVKGAEYASEDEIRVVSLCASNDDGRLIKNLPVEKLINEVVISPLLPHEEAEAIIALIRGQVLDWKTKPLVRRSCLLGDEKIEDDRTNAAIFDHFGDAGQESGLPGPLAAL